MDYYNKYLKYKQKYFELKNHKINMKGGVKNETIIKAANPEVVNIIMKEGVELNDIHYPGTLITLDNGGLAYQVKIIPNERKIKIINYDYLIRTSEIIKYNIDDVDTIWIGCGSDENVYDTSYDFYNGNSALVIKGSMCIYIGTDILSFELMNNEEVIYYKGTVQNSGVVYGYIETNLRFICTTCDEHRFIYKTDYKKEDKITLDCISKEDKNTHSLVYKQILPRAIDVEDKKSKKIKNINSLKKISKKDRPSPSESATLFDIGIKKKGNDGNMWIIKENKNGVKKWSKIND